MTIDRFLLRAFDYDQWANRQWIQALGRFKEIERAQRVVEHILQAQRYWLGVCGVEVVQASVDVGLEDLFGDTVGAWKAIVEGGDLDRTYRSAFRDGTEFELTLAEIALHVVNHGTYHRGHLRGLAQAEGLHRIPETDLVAFFLE